MKETNFMFLWFIQPNFKKNEMKGFIGLILLFSVFPFLVLTFPQHPIVWPIFRYLGISFGITLGITLLWAIGIFLLYSRVSIYHLEIFFACSSTNICVGLLTISYYYYYLIEHPFSHSSTFIWVTQIIFWAIYIGYDWMVIRLENKYIDEISVLRDMEKSLNNIPLLIGCVIAGILIVVFGIIGIHILNNRLFGGIEETKDAIQYFMFAIFIQLAAAHNFQKVHYMKKYSIRNSK